MDEQRTVSESGREDARKLRATRACVALSRPSRHELVLCPGEAVDAVDGAGAACRGLDGCGGGKRADERERRDEMCARAVHGLTPPSPRLHAGASADLLPALPTGEDAVAGV